YREWLLKLTICDPACGSGAFLNQALEFLIAEHHYVDELQAKLLEESIVYPDVEASILENNLFGVDINEESVEIAKLSLWLRTAQKGRKLTSLNNNIKCGNSLIDDPDVAGEKAFKWEEEFSSVFKNGGFDVVIGNPPYVRAELLGDFLDHFEKEYEVYHSASDLFAYFYEKGSKLIKENGLMGYISNTFDKTTAGKVLRKYLAKNSRLYQYVDFTEVQIFEGATTYPVIITLNRKDNSEQEFTYIKIPKERQAKIIEIESVSEIQVLQSTLDENSWSFLPKEKAVLLKKLSAFPTIKEKFGKSYRGLITGLNKAFIIQNKWSLSDQIKYLYEGKEIKKWQTPTPEQKIILFESGWTKETYGEDIS
ncbi:MAG: DNA methyltransferase, partial [Candidatus Paceibacterota bacterium]